MHRPAGSVLADRGYAAFTALACIAAVAAIAYLIAKTAGQSGVVWRTYGVWDFITGREWVPTPVEGDPLFGALPFIYGTLATSAIAMLIAVPVAVGVALATTVFLPRRLRGPIASAIDLLAAVPSVAYGLWGVTVLVPAAKPVLEWLSEHSGGIGILAGPVLSGSYILAGLVLAVMVIPIVAAIAREVLLTVPDEQREAALALGATRWEMVRSAMVPWARSGIVGASALGLGRAVGETIAIAMLLGNTPNIFGSLLGPGSTLAGVIALETGEASELQLASLTALAIVLFVMAFAVNALARLLVGRTGRRGLGRRAVGRLMAGGAAGRAETETLAAAEAAVPIDTAPLALSRVGAGRRIHSGLAEGSVMLCLALALLPLGLVIGQMLVEGVPALSAQFFSELPPLDPNTLDGGIKNALIGTLILMGIATVVSAPLGVLVALFISERAGVGPTRRRLASAMGFLVDVLLGVPSIVVGVTIYLGLVIVMGHFSALAGGIALGVIMFPIVVRAADEVLRLVPETTKEAAIALGAPRWRSVWSVVLPAAAPGIVTGVLLGLARASGETAPLLFTSLGNQVVSTALLEPIASIPQLIFDNVVRTATPASIQLAWGAALVLVSIVFVLSLAGRAIARLAVRT